MLNSFDSDNQLLESYIVLKDIDFPVCTYTTAFRIETQSYCFNILLPNFSVLLTINLTTFK